MNNDIKISFQIPAASSEAFAENYGNKSLQIKVENSLLECSIYYDFSPAPLILKAFVKTDDKAELILLSYRLELYINGRLCDEEWPCGKRLFNIGDEVRGGMGLCTEEYTHKKAFQPDVCSVFTNAEGWQPEADVFVGDCMPYTSKGRYHVLYLKDRRHHKSKWGLGAHQWEHISTNDFVKWQIHPTAVEITEPYEGSICTGSRIEKANTEYLFYTVRMADRSPAPICRSISTDGYHFEKDRGFKFILSKLYDGASARDPKVVKGADGLYHMFITTSLIKEKRGCLAHLVSEDIDTWTDTGTPIYVSEDKTQPECPDYIFYNGNYYLIFSLDGEAHYLMSKRPFSEWKKPKNDIIPCSTVPKGDVWNKKIVFTGFLCEENSYAGTITFTEALCNKSGELVFK